MSTDAPHPYLRFLAAWDREEPDFFAALDELVGRPVRFSGLTRSPRDLDDCLAFFRNDPMAAVTEAPDGTLLLPGNPHLVLRQLLERHYLPLRTPWWSRVPGTVQRSGAALRRSLAGKRPEPRPGSDKGLRWPDEPRVDIYRRHLYEGLVEERGADPGDLLGAPWPRRKRYALCLTYEVATSEGMKLVSKVMAEGCAHGARPAFFVSGRPTLWDHEVLEEVTAEGGEVGLLGSTLSPKLAHTRPARIRKALDRVQPLVERHRVVGYRHRSSRVTRELLTVLAERFAYDSSIPDSARCPVTGIVRGSAVAFPFANPPMMEIPVTTPPDQALRDQGYEGLDFLDLLRRKVLAIRERHGLATLTVRLAPDQGGQRVQRDLLGALLGELADQGDVWFATPAQVARHWERAAAPVGANSLQGRRAVG